MLAFFHSPGSCSNGILYLLHELDVAYEYVDTNSRTGGTKTEDYMSLNPKGKVPALRLEDGSVLTEFPAIAMWLAETHPDAGLWPEEVMARTRIREALDFIIASVHMRGFTFVKVPMKFLDDAEGQARLQAFGHQEVAKGLAVLSDMLGKKDYLLGDFGIVDCALFYVLTWAEMENIDIPENLAACLDRLRSRPAYHAARPLLSR